MIQVTGIKVNGRPQVTVSVHHDSSVFHRFIPTVQTEVEDRMEQLVDVRPLFTQEPQRSSTELKVPQLIHVHQFTRIVTYPNQQIQHTRGTRWNHRRQPIVKHRNAIPSQRLCLLLVEIGEVVVTETIVTRTTGFVD
ncbi:hypothetical protein D3C72_1235860 [compost metagenome]